jgi:phenylalanine-4-hydroxylase
MNPATSIETQWLTDQRWEDYTGENHEVWGILSGRRMGDLEANGSRLFLEGADLIGLRPDRVPDLRDVNARLSARTGWAAVPVKGFIPAAQFFASLAQRRFPTTITVRPKAQLDYLPEPDIFHDVFGHVPLHAHPHFADFLQTFGQLAGAARTEEDVRRAARLFWFTVEFGLIREDGRVKVYGSGLISSHGDCANALGPRCDRRPFDLDAVLEQPFEIDRFQDVLFVVESFEQLFEAVAEAGRRLHARRPAGVLRSRGRAGLPRGRDVGAVPSEGE